MLAGRGEGNRLLNVFKNTQTFQLKCSLLCHEGINWDMFAEPFLLPTPCLQMQTVRAIQAAQLLLWDQGRVFLHHITPSPWAALVWKPGFGFPEISGECDRY